MLHIMAIIDRDKPSYVAIGIEQFNPRGQLIRVFSLYVKGTDVIRELNEIIDKYAKGSYIQTFTYRVYQGLRKRKDTRISYRNRKRYKNSLWELTLDAIRRRSDVIALI